MSLFIIALVGTTGGTLQAQNGEQCFVSPQYPNQAFAKSVWWTNGDTITIRTSLSRGFVDNTYGVNALGWGSKGHTFGNLTGSDNLQLSLMDNNNAKVLEFKLDYITASSLGSSGYKCLGVTGGDGKMLVGSATNILGANSSMDDNLNKLGYKLFVDSPKTDTLYTPNPAQPMWIYTVWYEVKVRKSAFANGFKTPMITGVHASPSKLGVNTVTVVPDPCPVGSIGNFVWKDDNENGLQDPGEPGVKGVTVRLYNCYDNTLVATTTTDGNGAYLFSNLEVEHAYYVEFDQSTLPANGKFTSANTGSNDATDSDADPVTGRTSCEYITANENNLTYDAGVVIPLSCIGDRVWNDVDMDGVQDVGESGITGVTVKLYDCTTNTLISTKVTGTNGIYEFCDLPPGSYYLEFVKPAGYASTGSDLGGNDAADSDADPVTGRTACETLTPGENNKDYDAGFFELACIGNFVWNDLDLDGTQDPGESGLAGVTVRLYNCVGDALVGTMTTAADGAYGFCDLIPGSYYLVFSKPASYTSSPANLGGDDAKDSDADAATGKTACETLTPGEKNNDYDAGFFTCPVTLTCPPPVTVECVANVPAPDPDLSYVNSPCAPFSINWLGPDVTVGTTCDLTITRTYKATYLTYTSTCTQTIRVKDTKAPSIGQPGANTTISCPNSPQFQPPTATDNCDPSPSIVVVSDNTIPGSCPGVYTRTMTWKAVDDCGNESGPVSQTITVVDNAAPIIGQPGSSGAVICPNVPVFTPPTAWDACDPNPTIVLVSDESIPGACPGTYTRTKKWKAVDCSGHESPVVTQTIQVIDNVPPSIGSPGPNKSLACPASPVFTPPTASDNCDLNPSVILVSDVTTPGACPGLFSRTMTWRARDCSGNESPTVSQTINIIDNTPPVIGQAGSNATISCPNVPVFTEPTATDACDPNASVVLVSDVTVPGACPGVYSRTKIWKAVDCSGNQSPTVSQTVNVIDNTPPSLGSAGPNMTISCPQAPVFTAPQAADNCDPSVSVVEVSDVTVPSACPGVYVRTKTWKARDCMGNESGTVSQTINVIDNTPPTIGQAGANATISCPQSPVFTEPTASDFCDASPDIVLVSDITTPSGCPGVYSRTKVWKAVDCSGNESGSVSQTITVVDNTAPVIGTPGANATISCPNSPVFTPPTATDACDPAPKIELVSDVTVAGNCPGVYSRTRTWKAIDCSLNESGTVSQTITVVDNTPPTIGKPGANKAQVCDTEPAFDPPVVSDECGSASLVEVSTVQTDAQCPAGKTGTPYSITRTWKAVDCSGNESGPVSQTITFDCCREDYKDICLTSATKPDQVGGRITTRVEGDNFVIRVTFDKTFVDNTYGTEAIGWPKGHTFSNLVGSDNVQLALQDKAGTTKLQFQLDYITASSAAPSGYDCLGVLGGEGKMLIGSASEIVSATSSLDQNLNTFGYVLLTNSPATNASYTVNPTYPNWIYEVWYEVTVKRSAFGSIGFGKPVVTALHASPSKTGSNTEPVIECPLIALTKTDDCEAACVGSINVTATEGIEPYTYIWQDGATDKDRTGLCAGNYSVTVTDAGGACNSAKITVAESCGPTANEICFESPTKPNIVSAKSTWWDAGEDIVIRTTLSKTFVDNTFGTTAIGWGSKGHKFGDLVGSDDLEMTLYDKNNKKVLAFVQDYLTATSAAASGYKSLGVTGGDGKMVLGSASNITGVNTSLDENFNVLNYKLTTNSPATNSSYDPNPSFPNWIYDVWYEVRVKKSAFGAAGFGYPLLTKVHASPSKTGSNDETVIMVPCEPNNPLMGGGSNDFSETLFELSPNPASEFVNVVFRSVSDGEAQVSLHSMDGRIIQWIYQGETETGEYNEVNMSTLELNPGFYFVKLINGDVMETRKLLIAR